MKKQKLAKCDIQQEHLGKLIFNKRWLFDILPFILFTALGILGLDEDIWLCVTIIALGITLTIGAILVFPNSYRMDEKSITVYYGFGIKTTALWSELKHIEDHHAKGFLPWARKYRIGYFKTRFSAWDEAWIPKNRKTTRLLKKYYKRSIEKVG